MMKYMDHKLALHFIKTLESMIEISAEHNFLVYTSNPVKTVATLVFIVHFLMEKHQIVQFKGKKIRENLSCIANNIIDLSVDLQAVECLLIDKFYSGASCVDLIANIELIELLTNNLVDNAVSNIHSGSLQREFFMERSLSYRIVQSEVKPDPLSEGISNKPNVQIIRPRNTEIKGREVETSFFRNIFEAVFKDEEHTPNMKSFKLVVGHRFKFESWRRSPDTQHLIESLLIFVIGILMAYFANEVVSTTKSAKEQSGVVDAIESGASTGNLEAAYDKLEELSTDYLEDTLIILVLHTIAIGYFIKDLQELLY